ncbi:MAG: helix-turn-helix domain-containing protein [Bacteroides sp.]|nr:helix-turn-helix domain-containing protein [Bacteroides sp.]
MYEKKLPIDIDCSILITMEVIGGKWKCCIIKHLAMQPLRPSELYRRFPGANPRVITQQLKDLEFYGIITKKVYAEVPLRTEYFITDKGRTLLPLLDKIAEWGDLFRPDMKRILNID